MSDDIIDSINRAAKLFIDSGAAATTEDAVERLRGFRLHLTIGPAAAESPAHQAALLTALNCARRCLLGGVTISGTLDAALLVEVAAGATLADALAELGGTILDTIPGDVPVVAIGLDSDAGSGSHGFAVRALALGWRAGILPASAPIDPEPCKDFTLAGALAGGLAVAEVFAHLAGDRLAGHRQHGVSLWDQGPDADWRDAASDGPAVSRLPADMWIIGLGHLGQAFLWTIGLLPYADPSAVRLFLQDIDGAGQSTQSTSVLTNFTDEGRLKTRICADWAERRGFTTRLIERRFDIDMRVADDEPGLALCGVDNPDARRILEGAGFSMIFEAGLGNGVDDFRLIRTHSFPSGCGSAATWPARSAEQGSETGAGDVRPVEAPVMRPPAYADLRETGTLDECGLTRLADVAVGAPFVGMTAAALLVAQIVGTIAGGLRPSVLNVDIAAPSQRSLVMRDRRDVITFATAAVS